MNELAEAVPTPSDEACKPVPIEMNPEEKRAMIDKMIEEAQNNLRARGVPEDDIISRDEDGLPIAIRSDDFDLVDEQESAEVQKVTTVVEEDQTLHKTGKRWGDDSSPSQIPTDAREEDIDERVYNSMSNSIILDENEYVDELIPTRSRFGTVGKIASRFDELKREKIENVATHPHSYLEMAKRGDNLKIESGQDPHELRRSIIDYFATLNDYHARNKSGNEHVIYRLNNNNLVRVGKDRDGRRRLISVDLRGVWSEMSKYFDYAKITPIKGRDESDKSKWVIIDYREEKKTIPANIKDLVLGDFDLFDHFPYIKRVVRHPYFAPDGTLVTKNGYDPYTEIWLDNFNDIKESDLIHFETMENGREEALNIFEETIKTLSEFGYHLGLKSVYHINAIAFYFTPHFQPLIKYQSPYFTVTKEDKSYGGTLLLKHQAASYGEPYRSKPFPNNDDSKTNTEYFSATDHEIFRFTDELPHTIRYNQTMHQVLTERNYTYTPKFANDEMNIDVISVLAGAGILPESAGEFYKRASEIFLSVRDMARKRTPEELLEYVAKNQRKFEINRLSLIRYWIKCGMQLASDNIPEMPSFGLYRNCMGGFLEFYGYGDNFLKEDHTRDYVMDAEYSTDAIMVSLLTNAYNKGEKWTWGEVVEKAWGQGYSDLRELVMTLTKNAIHDRAGALGIWGKKFVPRTKDGRYGKVIVQTANAKGNRAFYWDDFSPTFDQFTIDERVSEDTSQHSFDCTCSLPACVKRCSDISIL